jgi:hypothetical protein
MANDRIAIIRQGLAFPIPPSVAVPISREEEAVAAGYPRKAEVVGVAEEAGAATPAA